MVGGDQVKHQIFPVIREILELGLTLHVENRAELVAVVRSLHPVLAFAGLGPFRRWVKVIADAALPAFAILAQVVELRRQG